MDRTVNIGLEQTMRMDQTMPMEMTMQQDPNQTEIMTPTQAWVVKLRDPTGSINDGKGRVNLAEKPCPKNT